VFFPSQPFQPSLTFQNKEGTYPPDHLVFVFWAYSQALDKAKKGLPGKNTLAYLSGTSSKKKKSFYNND